MKRVIEVSEVLGQFELPAGPGEVFATGVASYDELTRRVSVSLDALVRAVDLVHKEATFRPAWLPRPQTQTEAVDPEEASEVARDVFQRWVRKVRMSVPASAD